MKIVKILAIVVVAYIALGLTIEAAIGYFQPEHENTVVLRTFDEEGEPYERVLTLREPGDGTLWVESGHWFRGWYHNLRRDPEVELIRNDQAEPYEAVPLDDPETVEMMKRVMGKPGLRYYIGRTLLLWAPIRPVRLDPRDGEEGEAGVE